MLQLFNVQSTPGVCMLQLFEVPFIIALDHKRQAVVVAIRGTASMEVGHPSCNVNML